MSITAPALGSTFYTRTILGGEVGGAVILLGSAEVSSSNPFPVAIQGALGTVTIGAGSAAIGTVGVTGSVAVTGTFFQATQPVSIAGTVAVSLASQPLPTGAATDASLTALGTKLDTINTSLNTSGALPAGTNSIGTVVLGAGSAAVGSVSVTGSVAVTGPLTDTQLRATVVPVDTVKTSTSTDRGVIIGFSGAVISTTSGSPTITLTTAPTSGAVVLGQQLTAAGVTAGTTINALASGALNVAGSTYTLSANATATATGVASTSVGPQQIMASNTSRRGVSYQVQSASANVWVNGTGSATADYHSLKIPSQSFYESAPTHVGTGAISAIADTAATPLYAREY